MHHVGLHMFVGQDGYGGESLGEAIVISNLIKVHSMPEAQKQRNYRANVLNHRRLSENWSHKCQVL